MKKIKWLVVAAATVVCLALLAACSQDVHTHVYDTDWTKTATEHWHAATCEHSDEKADKAEHTFGDWKYGDTAVCLLESDNTRECSICGYVETKAKAAHTYGDWKYGDTPVCLLESDNTRECSTCGRVETIAKAAHTFGDWKYGDTAACLLESDNTRECSTCGHVDTIVKAEHDLQKTEAVAATCKSQGTLGYWSCGVCDKKFSDAAGANEIAAPVTVPVNANAHTYGAWKYGDVAACLLESDNTRECSTCGHMETIAKAEHDLQKTEAVAATCKSEGTLGYWSCGVCDKKFSDAAGEHEIAAPVTVPVDANAHKYGAWKYGDTAVCLLESDNTRECSTCGHVETIAKAEHKYGAWKYGDTAVCLLESDNTRECSTCGHVDTKAKAPHDLTGNAAVSATCTTEGTQEYWSCGVCDKKFSDAAGEHEIDAPASIPVDADAHTVELVAAVASTCAVKGHVEYYECSDCHKKFGSADAAAEVSDEDVESELDPKNHGDALTFVPSTATCAVDGDDEYYICENCGKINIILDGEYKETINNVKPTKKASAVPHTYEKVAAKAWSCTEKGCVEHYSCTVCNKYFQAEGGAAYDDPVFAVGGHIFDGAPVLNADGTAVSNHCSVCGEDIDSPVGKSLSITAATATKPDGVDYYSYTHITGSKMSGIKLPFLGAGTYTFTAYGFATDANAKTNPYLNMGYLIGKAGVYSSTDKANKKIVSAGAVSTDVADGVGIKREIAAEGNKNVFLLQISELYGAFPQELLLTYNLVNTSSAKGASDILLYVTYEYGTPGIKTELPLVKGDKNQIVISDADVVPADSYISGWTYTSETDETLSLQVGNNDNLIVYIKKNGVWKELIVPGRAKRVNFQVTASEPVQFYFASSVPALYNVSVLDALQEGEADATIVAGQPIVDIVLPTKTVEESGASSGGVLVVEVGEVPTGKYKFKVEFGNGLGQSMIFFGKNINPNCDEIFGPKDEYGLGGTAEVYWQNGSARCLNGAEYEVEAVMGKWYFTVTLDLKAGDRLVLSSSALTDAVVTLSLESANAYIFTTTAHITTEYLSSIESEMQEGEYLIIACRSYDSGADRLFKNIKVKKIPQVLLDRCEFGKENYNLNIIEVPTTEGDE